MRAGGSSTATVGNFPIPLANARPQARLTEDVCLLDQDQRRLVELTLADPCRVRGWTLSTVHCRSNHGHVMVAGDREPKEIREPFKAWCSRRLKAWQQERLRPLSAQDSSAAAMRPKWWAERGMHSLSTTRKALRPSSTTYARPKIMQIKLNPTRARAASRDAVNRPRETLGDSHLISSRTLARASGWYVTFFVAGVIDRLRPRLKQAAQNEAAGAAEELGTGLGAAAGAARRVGAGPWGD